MHIKFIVANANLLTPYLPIFINYNFLLDQYDLQFFTMQ